MIPLLQTQKNQIYRALEKGGLEEQLIGHVDLSISDNHKVWSFFSLPNLDGANILTFSHKDKFFFFSFFGSGNEWHYLGFPLGAHNEIEIHLGGAVEGKWMFVGNSELKSSWEDVLEKVGDWASRVVREISEDDLWGKFVRINAQLAINSEEDIDNKKFVPSEVQLIVAKLKILEQKIESTFCKTGQQKEYLERKFEYLKDSLRSLGRTDWVYTFIGVLSSVAIALSSA